MFGCILAYLVLQIYFGFVCSRGASVHLPLWALNDTIPTIRRNENLMVPNNLRNYTLSKNEEDVDAYENFFFKMTHGIILETGGGEFSNTLFFEKIANWRAIHVEADPNVYKTLKTTRYNQIAVHAALCSTSRFVHFVPSDIQAVGIWEAMSPSFINLFHSDLKNHPEKVEKLPVVLCVTVTTILKRLGFPHIDLWLLDTDGSEEDVLKGYDPKQVEIDVIGFKEERPTSPEHREENRRKRRMMEALGYICGRNSLEYRWCKRVGFIPHRKDNKRRS